MQLTAQQLTALGVSPRNAAIYAPLLTASFAEFEVNTPLRVCHHLAQLLHEAQGLNASIESMNYTPVSLLKTFPKYFTPAMAQLLARTPGRKAQQERIGNIAYANRNGNGPESSGEGFKFRGRGLIQLTGKINYKAAGEFLGVDLVASPHLAATPPLAARIAGWYWKTRNLNFYADRDDVLSISQLINQGSIPRKDQKRALPNGFTDRVAKLALCKSVLTPA